MARRKRILDDGDSDSDNTSEAFDFGLNEDPDLREERELFENPYGRKRRRKNGKEDALYGVFGDDSDNENDYKRRPSSRKTHWTKAPAFVSSENQVDLKKEGEDTRVGDPSPKAESLDEEEDDGEDDGSQGEGVTEIQEYSDDSEPSRPPSPRVRLADDNECANEDEASKPRIGGIGFKPTASEGETSNTAGFGFRSGIGARGASGGMFAKGGIGAGSGIGSRVGLETTNDAGTTHEAAPTPSFSKAGIGSAKSLRSSFAFTSSSTLQTVSLSEDNELDASPASILAPSVQPEGSLQSSRASPAPAFDGIPAAFGRPQTQSQRFKREAAITTPKPANLPASEAAHFSKLSGSFGSRMLAKMGWQTGTGLGVTGEGIITPIESKLRPQNMGIAFKGFKEKTEQSKREARRRGEVVSDEEDEKTKTMRRRVKEAEQRRSDVWKKPRKVKTKTEHKTYEQIIAEAGHEAPAAGVGRIIDATGAVPREVSSLAEVNLNSWAPTSDSTRIPEIRHNVRLIAEACKTDLDSLAREAKALHTRKSFTTTEESRLRKKIEDEIDLIARFQQIQIVVNEISTLSKELASMYEVSLEPFSPLVNKLVDQFPLEFEKYELDEVVVAAVAPLMRRMVTSWEPLKDPKGFISVFRGWKKALKIRDAEESEEAQVEVYGRKPDVASPAPEDLMPMTPFESLLWNVWLPKVRSIINNDWSPEDPQPAVKLYEAWSTFLPPFVRDNILDQLILPKVHKAVADWNPKRSSVSLRSIVFPWLPIVGLRLEVFMSDPKRKIKSLLRNWVAGDDIPDDLSVWRGVYDKGEWDSICLKYIIPKLSANLRTNFRIDPRNQAFYMPAFQQCLDWLPFLRPSIFSQLFELEFFPEWLRILHIWLIQPKASYGEVQKWYQEWRDMFPKDLSGFSGVSRGFTRGLELMHEAMELGPEERSKLKKPDFKKELALAEEIKRKSAGSTKLLSGKSSRTREITFKTIVEEFAATHNLLFMPIGKVHVKSRMPLYRVSPGTEVVGKKGMLVYVLDDAVWASVESAGGGSEEDEFRAISLDEMVSRAMGVASGGS